MPVISVVVFDEQQIVQTCLADDFNGLTVVVVVVAVVVDEDDDERRDE